jgi:hypothetical protein
VTPLALRIARLLLVAGCAAAIGCIAVIISRASGISPVTALFALPAVLFALAAASLGRDARRGRALGLAGALTLAALGTLAGFGAGDVTFPAASLGVLAAWAAFLHPPRRQTVVAFLVYLAIGVALAASRPFFGPFTLGTIFLWPITLSLGSVGSGAFPLVIFAALGAGIALAARAFWDAPVLGRPSRAALALSAIAGTLAVGALLLYAQVRADTSLRFEIDPAGALYVFAGAALISLGATSLRRAAAVALVALAIGAGIAASLAFARATVVCASNGVSTSSGPWPWSVGPMSSRGSLGSAGGATGSIERAGERVTYRCEGGRLTEFREERR